MKLKDEERLELEEMLGHSGVKALWKVFDDSVEMMEREVIQLVLDSTPESSIKILQAKARAEGAARLLLAVKRRLAPKASKNE